MEPRIESDEYNAHGEHVVEIPLHDHGARPAPRRSFATLGVAAFLTLAGVAVTIGVISTQTRRENEDAARREQLREGWQVFGALAATGAAENDHARTANGAPAAPPPVAPNVVVVNVPTPAPSSEQASREDQAPPNGEEQAPPSAPNTTAPGAPATASAPAQPQAAASNTPIPLPLTPGLIAPPLGGGRTPAASVPPGIVSGAPGPAAGQALPTGSVPASLPTPALPPGTTQATPATPALPGGSVPASSPLQSLPTATVPASPPASFPASQSCGLVTCNADTVCCNPSCGVCIAPGAVCPQRACG